MTLSFPPLFFFFSFIFTLSCCTLFSSSQGIPFSFKQTNESRGGCPSSYHNQPFQCETVQMCYYKNHFFSWRRCDDDCCGRPTKAMIGIIIVVLIFLICIITGFAGCMLLYCKPKREYQLVQERLERIEDSLLLSTSDKEFSTNSSDY